MVLDLCIVLKGVPLFVCLLSISFTSPLENQSYSNNPNGRLNPVLPRPIQDRLEKMGIISTNNNGDLTNNIFRSTQTIDLKKRRVRNIVTFSVPSFSLSDLSSYSTSVSNQNSSSQSRTQQRRASLTVDIDFTPVPSNPRRIHVKFQSCRVVIPDTPIDVVFPLGFIGPTGWLQTNYVDDKLRITRGHKGSVFVLKRP
jgi:PAP_fibrillin